MKRDLRRTISRIGSWLAVVAVVCGIAVLSGCSLEITHFSVTIPVSGGIGIPQAQLSAQSDPSGTDLANFNTSEALVNLSTSNLAVTTTSGTVTLTVSDASTGQVYGTQSFGYVVQGSSLYAQDPTTLHNWLSQFSSYSDVYVSETISAVSFQYTATSGTASVTAKLEYNGTTYASTYKSWPISSGPCSYPRKCDQN